MRACVYVGGHVCSSLCVCTCVINIYVTMTYKVKRRQYAKDKTAGAQYMLTAIILYNCFSAVTS